MTNVRSMLRRLEPAFIGTGLLVLAVLLMFAWFAQAFSESRELGMSRLVYGWRDPRFAAFHRLFLEISPGMTRKDLDDTIWRLYPDGGQRLVPVYWVDQPSHVTLFMNPETETEPNCEGIFLQLTNGIIVSKSYSMD